MEETKIRPKFAINPYFFETFLRKIPKNAEYLFCGRILVLGMPFQPIFRLKAWASAFVYYRLESQKLQFGTAG
jgi:hypothetical protein